MGSQAERAEIRAHLPWNFTWGALSGALFELGTAFVDAGTVLAAFLTNLTGAALAVGAAESIRRYGWLVPQLFAAGYARGRRYRKPLYVFAGGGRALALATLAGLLVLLRDARSGVLLAVFFALWTTFAFISGVAGVPYNDIVGRTIPAARRSTFLAVRFFAGGLLGVGAGLLIRGILRRSDILAFPINYALIFGLGAGVLALSTLCFALMREPPAPVEERPIAFRAFLREGLQVLRTDRRFRFFLVVQWLAGVTLMVTPLYVVQARRGGLAEAEVGTLIAAQMAGQLASNPLWGLWGDRRGKLSLLKVLALTGLVSPFLGLTVPGTADPRWTLTWYMAVFFFLGAVVGGQIIGDLSYLMEVSPDERRPEYTGYMNALVAPTRLLPLLAAGLADTVGFGPVFAVAMVAGVLRLGMLKRLEEIERGVKHA
jgi:MFS family permease